MKLAWRHRWDLTPAQARQLQSEARRRVSLEDDAAAVVLPPCLFAVDVGYDRATDRCAASLIQWDVGRGRVVAAWSNLQPSTFPYVPGLLSFRELPPLLPLLTRLRRKPELILCDGQGYAHPRRIGLASHLGVLLDCPTLGWAKSRLIGEHARLPEYAGAAVILTDGGDRIGWVFRSRANCRPTFVSPGHRLSLERSLELARALMGRYRLCDPARAAHQATREALAG